MSKVMPACVQIRKISNWDRWQQESARLAQAQEAYQRLGHDQYVALRFKMPQYSRWVSSDLRRLFIVLDHWHGEKAQVKLLEVDTCTELIRDSAEVLTAIKDGKLVAF